MTRERAWELLTRQHPEYLERPPRFTPTGLRQFFDWVWEIAEKEGGNMESGRWNETLNCGTAKQDMEFLRTLMGMDK